MDTPKQRTSLTKTQLQSDVGLELLSICQSITTDGRLADEEIQALNNWVHQNTTHGIPAIRFLSATLSRVLEDGIITPEERQSVAKAIEAVLPPDERKYASAIRRQVENEERLRLKNAAEQDRTQSRERRERNRPIGYTDFMVAGTRHSERAKIINNEVRPGMSAFLKRERDNPHSEWAVAILTANGSMIGYAPEEQAIEIAPMLDDGALHIASIKKVLEYDSGPVPVIVASLFDPNADLPGLRRQNQAPSRNPFKQKNTALTPQRKHSTGSNAKAWLVVIFAIVIALVAISLSK